MNIFRAASVISKTEMSRPLTEAADKNSHMSQRGGDMLNRDYNPCIQDRDASIIFQVGDKSSYFGTSGWRSNSRRSGGRLLAMT